MARRNVIPETMREGTTNLHAWTLIEERRPLFSSAQGDYFAAFSDSR